MFSSSVCRFSGLRKTIHHAVIPGDSLNIPHIAKLLDMVMLVCLTGKERTLSEFKMSIEKAGLKFTQPIPIETEAKAFLNVKKYKFQFLFLVA